MRYSRRPKPGTMLLSAGVIGFVLGMPRPSFQLPAPMPLSAQPSAASLSSSSLPTVSGCRAVDGDTLRCGGERIRLVGIDSAELPGHCRPGRNCVEGDPYAATSALSAALGSSMTIRRFGTDHYGRTLALVGGPSGDLSCHQLRLGHAIYREDWDVDGLMMRGCA